MKSAIELHDSDIGGIHEINGGVIVEFSPAYVHRSDGEPGVDAGTGWVQNARVTLTRARVSGDWPALPETLWGGNVTACGIETYLLPLPLEAQGPIELRLVFATGHEVVVSGDSIVIEMIGKATYVEDVT